LGGKGVVSVISNIAPADMANMVKVFEAGDLAKARQLHYKMIPLIDCLFIETNPVPVKAALSMMGLIEYEMRLPLCKLTQNSYDKLKKAMTDYGLLSQD